MSTRYGVSTNLRQFSYAYSRMAIPTLGSIEIHVGDLRLTCFSEAVGMGVANERSSDRSSKTVSS
jgi:hypothetical protein